MDSRNKMVDEDMTVSIRRTAKNLEKMILRLLLLLILFCLPGCDLGIGPEKIEGLPNTFTREPLRKKENVLSVLVQDSESVVWLIMAVKPINLKDFKVQVGFVPEGFEQMIPPGNQKFTPIVGNRYSIDIVTDVRYHECAYVLQGRISWIAEK